MQPIQMILRVSSINMLVHIFVYSRDTTQIILICIKAMKMSIQDLTAPKTFSYILSVDIHTIIFMPQLKA